MRKIAVVTGTRADYGILRPVMKAIEEHSELELCLVVSSMHLSKDFGHTIDEIQKDGFDIKARVAVTPERDSNAAMAKSVGACASIMADVFKETKPHIVVLLGDRSEMLAAAVTSAYMNIPVAHIHGGDVSGNIDEPVRHAITKLSHIHFPATKESADRVVRMGEEPWRVHVVGAPGLDSIVNAKLTPPAQMAKRFDLDLTKPIILMVQHPVTTESDLAADQIRATLDAIVKLQLQTVLVYPNADAGGRRMISVVKEYAKHRFVRARKSIQHDEYVSLMAMASVIVGNSSSAIIEAPSFHLPAVNIGTRQEGRQRAGNVIDVGHDTTEIVAAIEKTLYDNAFKEKVETCANPYGDGQAGIRIAGILGQIAINRTLLQKKLTF